MKGPSLGVGLVKSNTVTEARNDNYCWVILGLLTLSQLAMSMGAYAWGPLAPFLRTEFNISRAQVGLIVSVLYFTSVVIAIPSGLMIDRLGARRMLVFALISMGGFFALLSQVNVFSLFLILAALSGIGYGMINQISTKGLMLWFSSKLRATAMGIKQTGVTFGGALGAVMLPAIAVSLSWRWAVAVPGFLMIAVAILVVLGYRERPATVSELNKVSDSRQSSSMLKDLSRLRYRPELIILCVVGAMMAASQTSITSFLVLYLQEKLSFSMRAAGGCLTVFMMSGAAGRVCWGIISDRVFNGNRQKPMVILCVVAFASALAVAFLSPAVPAWLCYSLGAVMGFVFMGWNALSITLGAEIAGPELAGSVTGFTLTVIWAGIIVGPPIFGVITDNAGYFWGWLMLSLFGLLSACLFTYSIRFTSRTRTNT